MSNKDHLHLLTDDDGKPVAEKPKPEVGPIKSFKEFLREFGEPAPMRYMHPGVQVSIMDEPTFNMEYLGQWDEGMNDPRQRPIRARTETIQDAYPSIINMIEDQRHTYELRFRRRPEYISLNRPAYRSYWLKFRHGSMNESTMVNGDRFLGIDVICNPWQTFPVVALGDCQEEGIEGRLNYEQS